MKTAPKTILTGVCILAFSGVLLAGCSSSNSDQEILDKLDQMESEIAALEQSGQAASGDAVDAAATAGSDASASSTEVQPAPNTGTTDLDSTIADLEARAAAAIQTADAATVPQAAADRPQAYFDAKAPLEALENEVDMLEDQLEMGYRDGSIDRDAFWGFDQRVNAVENSLDTASDRLEMSMGVDD